MKIRSAGVFGLAFLLAVGVTACGDSDDTGENSGVNANADATEGGDEDSASGEANSGSTDGETSAPEGEGNSTDTNTEPEPEPEPESRGPWPSKIGLCAAMGATTARRRPAEPSKPPATRDCTAPRAELAKGSKHADGRGLAA